MRLDDGTRAALRATLMGQLFPTNQDADVEVMAGALPSTMPSAGGIVLMRFVIPFADVVTDGARILIPAGIEGAFVAAGTAGWARWIDGDGVHRMYLPCSTASGVGVFRLADLRIVQGVPTSTIASVIAIGGGA